MTAPLTPARLSEIRARVEMPGPGGRWYIGPARQDIPDLLAEVDRLTAALDVAENALEHGTWSCLHCGYGASVHSVPGHPSSLCVWEPYWKTDYDTAKEANHE